MKMDFEKLSDEDLLAFSEKCHRGWVKYLAPWYFYPLLLIGLIFGLGGISMLMSRGTNLEQLVVIGGVAALLVSFYLDKQVRQTKLTCMQLYFESLKEIDKRKRSSTV